MWSEIEALGTQLTRQVEGFLRARSVNYQSIDLDTVVPIVALLAIITASPILIRLIVALVRGLWRALTWRSVEGYIAEVDTHSEIKQSSGKSSSRSYYYATRLVALYRDEDNVPQVAYSRSKGWRQAWRAAQRYRVGQKIALRLSRSGRYALFGRILDDERGIGSSPLITRL